MDSQPQEKAIKRKKEERNSQLEKGLEVALPVILSYFEHPEARRYSSVSRIWQRSVAKVQYVTPALNNDTYVRNFLKTAKYCEDIENGIQYEIELSSEIFQSNINVEIKFQSFPVEKFEGNESVTFTGNWEVSAPLFESLFSPKKFNELKPGNQIKSENEKVSFEVSHLASDAVILIVKVNPSEVVFKPLSNAEQDALIERVMHSPVREGVCWGDHLLEPSLSDRLNELVDDLRDKIPEDYHPGSNGKVRDIVHPALYSYIEGVSPIRSDAPTPVSVFRPSTSHLDTWGRPYEDSKYQWLSTWVEVDENMKVSIDDDINGLRPRSEFVEMYECLERVLGRFIPFLEAVIAYGRTIDIRTNERIHYTGSGAAMEDRELDRVEFRSCGFQVIPKIVDYELNPGDSYEGVWHVEGMSHEHIVATCLYIASCDEDIEGGELMFQRAWSEGEADLTYYEVGQGTDGLTKSRLETGLRPLGRVATKEGRGIVFPNSHVHKIAKMVNKSTTKVGRRRIVVFFVVDPTQPIISTSEVPDQREIMSREQAEEHRLALMHERKHHKQDWNVREIGLCEH